jgi:hypothetical protein
MALLRSEAIWEVLRIKAGELSPSSFDWALLTGSNAKINTNRMKKIIPARGFRGIADGMRLLRVSCWVYTSTLHWHQRKYCDQRASTAVF